MIALPWTHAPCPNCGGDSQRLAESPTRPGEPSTRAAARTIGRPHCGRPVPGELPWCWFAFATDGVSVLRRGEAPTNDEAMALADAAILTIGWES